MVDSDALICGHVRRTWDGPYAMDDVCIADQHPSRTWHGPWLALPTCVPSEWAAALVAIGFTRKEWATDG